MVSRCVFTSPRPFYIFFFKGVGPPKNIGISAHSNSYIHFLSLGKLHLLCESGRRARSGQVGVEGGFGGRGPPPFLHVNGDRLWKEFHSLVRRGGGSLCPIGYLRQNLLKLFHSISDESSIFFLENFLAFDARQIAREG